MDRRAFNNVDELKWINLAAYGLNVVVTYLVGATGLFGTLPTNAELSAKYQTLVTPAAWAFSIWGLIFLAQGIWVLQQFHRGPLSEAVHDYVSAVHINYLWVVLAQVAWALAFSLEYLTIAMVLMVLILVSLYVIVERLAVLSKDETRSNSLSSLTSYLLTEFPFAIHFGWILAATVLNANVVLVARGFSANTQYLSALGSLAFFVIAGLALVLMKGYLTAPMAASWGLFGIYMSLLVRKIVPLTSFTASQMATVQYGALGAMIIILLGVTAQAVWQFRTASTSGSNTVYHRVLDN